MKKRNRLCKSCLRSFPQKIKEQRFCSSYCELIGSDYKTRCRPKCDPENISLIGVVFKDGTKHIKTVCCVCREGRFVNKSTNKPINENMWTNTPPPVLIAL